MLNRRQAQWAQELAGYDFKICFRPGKHNGKADYLSRRPEYRLEKGGDRKPEMILKPDNISEESTDYIIPLAHKDRICAIPLIHWRKDFLEEVRSTAHSDEQYKSGLHSLCANPSDSDYIKPSEHLTAENDDILHYRGRLYIPKPMINAIHESEHDSKVAGHFGQDKTIEQIRRNFCWPGMDSDIKKTIQACPDCQRDKSRRHRTYGLLSPLELPYAPWQSIAMDFITDLPRSNNCTELWVVIDRFSKMAHFIPMEQDKKNTEDLAGIFAREIWRLHGLLQDIVMTVTPGSHHTPGRISCLSQEFAPECPLPSTLRPMDKPKESTRLSKHTSGHTLTRSRMIW